MTFGKLRASRKVKAFRKVAGRGELSRVCLADAERCAARAVAVWAATAARRGGTGERTGESARGSIGRSGGGEVSALLAIACKRAFRRFRRAHMHANPADHSAGRARPRAAGRPCAAFIL